MATVTRMLLVDGNAHTAALLVSGIGRRGLGEVQVVTTCAMPEPLKEKQRKSLWLQAVAGLGGPLLRRRRSAARSRQPPVKARAGAA